MAMKDPSVQESQRNSLEITDGRLVVLVLLVLLVLLALPVLLLLLAMVTGEAPEIKTRGL